MASIRQRGETWQARVSRKGYKTEVRSFATRQDATRWARSLEAEIDQGSYVSQSLAQRTSLNDVIERYIREVLPSMKGARDDAIRLRAIQRRWISRLSMVGLTPQQIGRYRDERLQEIAPSTVLRELAYLSAIINHARREWGIHIENPVASIRKPSMPPGRARTLSLAEEGTLLEALQPAGRRSTWMKPLVLLALETAMRRGELLALRWEHVDLEKCTAFLPETKNGERRTVPLSSRAVELLRGLPRAITGVVFPMSSYAVAAAFSHAVERAGIQDFHFQHLRHTAITRMANKLPNVVELSAVTGHKNLRMLQRYYHPDPVNLAAKLG